MSHAPNFLLEEAPPPRRRKGIFVAAIFAIIFGAWFVSVMVSGVRVLYPLLLAATNGRNELVWGVGLVREQRFEDSLDTLRAAHATFLRADRALERTFLPTLVPIPFVRTHIAAFRETFRATLLSTDAVMSLVEFVVDIDRAFLGTESSFVAIDPSAITFSSLTPEEKRRLLAQVILLVPKLESALALADRAAAEPIEISDQGLVAPVSRAVRVVREKVLRVRDDLRRLVPLAQIAPYFAGYPEPQELLILFLNNAELRPGGGFIGTIGRLSVTDATVSSFETKDVYAIDGPSQKFMRVSPPAPLERYLGIRGLFMRDANWSPDFRISAEAAADFYERETTGGAGGRVIDSVIGLTPTFAADILRVTGPITVEDRTFTPETLFELLEYEVEQGYDERGVPRHARKEIVEKLARAVIAKLATLPFSAWEEILVAIDVGFREKQLMFYSRDMIQDRFDEYAMSGAVDMGDADFFMAVDANMASLKSDPAVKRALNYHIEPDGNEYKATVSITYRHEGKFDWKTTRYRTYTRLYAPPGSRFIEASGTLADDKLKNPRREVGAIDVGEELFSPPPNARGREEGVGRANVFGAFTAIEPGEERTLSFTYHLAPQVAERIRQGDYALKVQKQLGAFTHDLTLDLDFGKRVKNARPPEEIRNSVDSRYSIRTNLVEDRFFEITF